MLKATLHGSAAERKVGLKTAHALLAEPLPLCTVTSTQRKARLFPPSKAPCADQDLHFQGCDHPEEAPFSNSYTCA